MKGFGAVTKGCEISFIGNENVLELIMVLDAQ